MLQYLVILLDDTSTSYCHYSVTKTESKIIPIDILRAGILFAMENDLSVQIVYPNYTLSEEYLEAIDMVDHFNIMPSSIAWTDADAIVEDNWNFCVDEPLQIPLIVRTSKDEFFANYYKLKKSLKHTKRIDIVITDIEKFKEQDFEKYKISLSDLAASVEKMYLEGLNPQLNILTDRLMLKEMRNCGAGDTTITLAPNGKFYICPAFYYENEADNVGSLRDGLIIENKQLYKIDRAPICRHCDAWQCRRCIWLNRKTTLEVNTPSHEQCVVAHLERNASRMLQQNIRKFGTFLSEFDDIKEINYIDPFEKRKEWK